MKKLIFSFVTVMGLSILLLALFVTYYFMSTLSIGSPDKAQTSQAQMLDTEWLAQETSFIVEEKILYKGKDYEHPSKLDEWKRPLTFYAPSTFFIRVKGKETNQRAYLEVPQRDYYGTPSGVTLNPSAMAGWQAVSSPYYIEPPEQFWSESATSAGTEGKRVPTQEASGTNAIEKLLKQYLQ